jgi:hypothetical protein
VGKLVFGCSDSRLKVGVVSGASSRLWEVVVPHIGKHCWTVGEVGSLSGAHGVETFDYMSAEVSQVLLRQPVDVLLYETNGPSVSDEVWSDANLKLVIWFNGNSRSRPPAVWSMVSTLVKHKDLGGITDGSWPFHAASRPGIPALVFGPVLGVPSTLSSIVDRTAQGTPCVAPAETGEACTAHGLLSLKALEKRHKMQNVFPASGWVGFAGG